MKLVDGLLDNILELDLNTFIHIYICWSWLKERGRLLDFIVGWYYEGRRSYSKSSGVEYDSNLY